MLSTRLCLPHIRRYFSTTGKHLARPRLNAQYKSDELWEQRFACDILNDERRLRTINDKMINSVDLDVLELDIFMNVAQAPEGNLGQLREAIKLLQRVRQSLAAHLVIPSTIHALARLLLENNHLHSIIHLMEDRIQYGLFPDHMIINLLTDTALESEDYVAAARLSVWVMLQEEYGLNKITDCLSMYSLARYLESKTDFSDWKAQVDEPVEILREDSVQTQGEGEDARDEKAQQNKDGEDDDEDEDDVQYVRVPFLRNPYFDNHFDVTNPRLLCGKALSMVSGPMGELDSRLRLHGDFLGSILAGKWDVAGTTLAQCVKARESLGTTKELAVHYLNELHEVDAPKEEKKASLMADLENLPDESDDKLSDLVEKASAGRFEEWQQNDIKQFQPTVGRWAGMRADLLHRMEAKIRRDELIEEVRAKKRQLKLEEQFLYFYDNLRRTKLKRIEYE